MPWVQRRVVVPTLGKSSTESRTRSSKSEKEEPSQVLPFFHFVYFLGGLMSRMVRLTWKPEDADVVIEEVLLLDEDSPIYTDGPNGPIRIEGDVLNFFAKKNRVVFEDEEGIFGLHPEQILEIEVLE